METFSFHYEKLLNSQAYTRTRYGNILITVRYNLINLYPGKECFINTLCKNILITFLILLKYPVYQKKISFMQEFLPENNWMTFYGKFNSCKPENLNMLTLELFKMLLLVLTSKEKDYKPFWTPAYKKLSEKLWSPIKTDLPGSVMTSLNTSLKTQEAKLPLLTKTTIGHRMKNSQKTYCPLFMSSHVKKWEEEATKPTYKAIKIQLKINVEKKKLFQKWLKSSNYTYNKTVSAIRQGETINYQELRNKYVTANTKKSHPLYQEIDANIKLLRDEKNKCKGEQKEKIEMQIQEEQKKLKEIKKEIKSVKNEGVLEWELETPKEIRAEAIRDVCKAYKSIFTNIKQGNIKRFFVNYRKKRNVEQSMVIPKSFIKVNEGKIIIGSSYFNTKKDAEISMGNKTMKKHKNIEIKHDCRFIKKHNKYWLCIPVLTEKTPDKPIIKNYCGIDAGVRTFMTVFGNKGCYEYEHNEKLIKTLDGKIKTFKEYKYYIRKKKLLKIERRKENIINEIHWKTIRGLLNDNDILFYGDIKSHNMTRGKRNHTLNRDMNNLKFYKFKQRLMEKACEMKKIVIVVKEHNTTKTCSFCGTINDPKKSKIYHCGNCKEIVGRDVNAAKNILMKGLMDIIQ